MTRKLVVGAAIAGVLGGAALATSAERAFDTKTLRAAGEGRALYLTYCARCHGSDARGGFTNPSHTAAPDLTLIALRDGRFDRLHVSAHIDGRWMDRQGEMPRWGKVFASGRPGKEGFADLRSYALTRYLDFMQAPESDPVIEH